MLEYVILGLVLEKGRTGYEIKKDIEGGIGVFYKASYGSLYPALKRLTQKGQISLREDAQGGRQKKYYQATEQGRATFFAWLSSPLEVADGTDSQLARVYFFDRLPGSERKSRLEEYESGQRRYLAKLRELAAHFSGLPNSDRFYFKLSTLYYGISTVENNIRWCKHLRAGKPLPALLEEER